MIQVIASRDGIFHFLLCTVCSQQEDVHDLIDFTEQHGAVKASAQRYGSSATAPIGASENQ